MADYNQLNKATPSKLDMIFAKNKEINNAILVLIRTAYLNHHQETKERSKKLVECLEKDARIVIDQLNDDTFKENIQNKIESLLKSNFKLTSELKQQIKEDLDELINSNQKPSTEKDITKKQKTTLSKTRKIDKVLNNKTFISNLTEFTTQILKKNNEIRMKSLTKAFETGIKINQPKQTKITTQKQQNLANIITGGFGKLVSDFIKDKSTENDRKKSLFELLQEKVSEKISNTIKYIGGIKRKVLRGLSTIRKNLNPKGLLKLSAGLAFGALKLFNRLVFGLFKGLFSLVKGIFKLGLNIVKGVFTVFKTTIKALFKISKFITRGLTKLTVGFLKRIKNFILTPTGMFVTGFIIGWIGKKIYDAYHEIKQKVEDKIISTRDAIHEKRKSLVISLREDDKLKIIKKLGIFNKNMTSFKVKMKMMSRDLNKFTSSSSLGPPVGGTIGATLGKILGTAVSAYFPPLAAILPGVGVALGYIAGYYIGDAFSSIKENKEKDHKDQGEKNMLVQAITNKYRQKRNSKISAVRSSISDKIKKIDEKLSRTNSSDEKNRLLIEKKKYEETLKGLQSKVTIQDEDNESKLKHYQKTKQLEELLDKEIKEGLIHDYYGSIFTFFGVGDNKEKIQFCIDELLDNNYDELSVLPSGIDKNRLVAFRMLSRIKVRALGNAIDAYQKGLITFDEIRNIANNQIFKFANNTTIKAIEKDKDGRYSYKPYSLYEYLINGINSKINSSEQYLFEKSLYDRMDDDTKSTVTSSDKQNDIITQLTNDYIGRYLRNCGDPRFIEQYRDIIEQYISEFILTDKIKDLKDVNNEKLKTVYDNITQAISSTDTVQEDQKYKKEESATSKAVRTLLKSSEQSKLFTDQQNEEYRKEVEKTLIALGALGDDEGLDEDDINLKNAKVRNAEAKARYKVLFKQLMDKDTSKLVAVPVKQEDNIQDYLNANRDSGAEQPSYMKDTVSPIGSQHPYGTNYMNSFGM